MKSCVYLQAKNKRLPLFLLSCLCCQLLLLSSSQHAWAVGELKQKPGHAGCISGNRKEAECQKARVFGGGSKGPLKIVISPDGTSAYVASGDLVIFKRDPQTGELAQLKGKAGCISSNGLKRRCQKGRALQGAVDITISPDGAYVYVASSGSGAVAIFGRDRRTGELSQLKGKAGCISANGSRGACQRARGFRIPGNYHITISPDGTSVYVASYESNTVAIFKRDPQTGKLAQLSGKAGCISGGGSRGACQRARGFDGPIEITISPDGASAYAFAYDSEAVVIFSRDPQTGELRQLEGEAGCISDSVDGDRACQEGKGLLGNGNIAVSPDGTSVYVAARGVAIFTRDPQTGELSQLEGQAGCISADRSIGGCQKGRALQGAIDITTSPDGANVYVAGYASHGVAIFRRDPQTGELRQLEGQAGCISEDGDGGCQKGRALHGALGITTSPDGANVYVAAERGIAILNRARER
jgi:DNA-binding beta-propeller fold protein YncE